MFCWDPFFLVLIYLNVPLANHTAAGDKPKCALFPGSLQGMNGAVMSHQLGIFSEHRFSRERHRSRLFSSSVLHWKSSRHQSSGLPWRPPRPRGLAGTHTRGRTRSRSRNLYLHLGMMLPLPPNRWWDVSHSRPQRKEEQ